MQVSPIWIEASRYHKAQEWCTFWEALVRSAISTLKSITATTNRNRHSSVAVASGKCVCREQATVRVPGTRCTKHSSAKH